MMSEKQNETAAAWVDSELATLEEQCLRRSLRVYESTSGVFHSDGKRWVNLASNDYLDMAWHPRLKEAAAMAARRYGVGSTASRLVTGTLTLHEQLEQTLAQHKGYESALLFGSGYMTNAGVIPALVGRHDVVFADRLIHASVLDAVRLSGAKLFRFEHNCAESLKQLLAKDLSGRRLVVTEAVFSMDGDLAPLPEIAAVAAQQGAMLMVDEAHASGVFGPHGAGCVRAAALETTVTCCMGTLSKALGGYGGFVACSRSMRDWLINRARAFIYTTAPPPPVVAAAQEALELLQEHPELGPSLLANAQTFRSTLQELGLDTMTSASQIVPIRIGDNALALRVAERLREEGILVGVMRPPTVPPGTARLRCSLTLAHTPELLDLTARKIADACRAEGVI